MYKLKMFFTYLPFSNLSGIKALFNKYAIIGAIIFGVGVPGSAALADVDLAPGDITTCAQPTEGVTCSVSVDALNLGDMPVTSTVGEPIEVQLFSPQGGINETVALPAGTTINANGSTIVEFDWIPEIFQTGLTVTVNPNSTILESNFGNNFTTTPVTVVEPADNIDLAIADIMECAAPVEGQPCTVRVDIVNNGDTLLTATVAEPVEVDLFSPQGGLDEFMALPPGTELAANGGTASTIFSWVPKDKQTQLSAVVDSQDLIEESNEGNNERTIDVTVEKPLNVPTLGEWGMIAMATGLLLFSVFYVRRRSHRAQ